MYQSITVQNSDNTVYGFELEVADFARIELIAEQIRSQYIHGARNSGGIRTSISSLVSQAVTTAAELSRLWLDRSRSRGQLAGLNSRMLNDIGITGLEANQEVRKWFWQA